MMGGFMLSNLMSNFVSALGLLEFGLLEFMSQFGVFEFVLFEFMSQFGVFEFVLPEFMSQFGVFELVGEFGLLEFLFTERLAGDPAKNGAERTANRGANHGRRYAGYTLEKRCSTPDETAYAAGNTPPKLVSF